MNKTEEAYARHLEFLRAGGEILWWAFEPIRIRLADGAHYKIDFLVKLADGSFLADEIKGFEQAAAIVRWKVAAEKLPWATFRMLRRSGGGFEVYREVQAAI